jgi:ParB family chromosome partitioning protein
MKIALTDIKGLDHRVRQQMNPEKLEELTDSIKELGQIVPVKVRQNGNGYVLVYGHRRFMAAKAAGLKEIEAVVENVPDEKLLTVALAENVIREDMAAIDIAKALQTIKDETGTTNVAIGKKLGWSEARVRQYTEMLAPELGLSKSLSIGPYAVSEAKAGTAGDLKLAGQVLQKVAKDELSARDARKVAEVAKRMQDFGGQKAVRSLLSKRSDEILRAAEDLPARKPMRRADIREVKGTVHFSWLKDPRSLLAEEGIKAVSSLVSAIARSKEDHGGGKAELKHLRTMVGNVLKQIDDVLRVM